MFPSRGILLEESVGQRPQQGVYTILFADLRDSTALSEQISSEEMVALLNAFLGALARPIIAHGGIVDKFLGDGVMAVFGWRGDPSFGAIPAARSALAMRRAVRSLNEDRVAHGQEPVRFGVGVCTGEVILARIGLPDHWQFTAVGVTVNTAARLSGVCKSLGVDLVVSCDTTDLLPSTEFVVRSLGTAQVQGRTGPLPIATLD